MPPASVLPPASDISPAWEAFDPVQATPTPTASPTASVTPCLDSPDVLPDDAPTRSRDYEWDQGRSGIAGVHVIALGSPSVAIEVVDAYERRVATCATFTFFNAGARLPATMERAPAPAAGDRSACQWLSLTDEGVTKWYARCAVAVGGHVVTTTSFQDDKDGALVPATRLATSAARRVVAAGLL